MAVNQQLLAARTRKHWSQSQTAKVCGVDLQTYFRWEHEGQKPHGYNLDRLCEVFGCDMEELGYAVTTETTAQPLHQEPLARLTPGQVAAVERLIGESTMDRRDALASILAAAGIAPVAPLSLIDPEPWERLSAALEKPSTLNTATLDRFEHLIGESWELSNINELDAAEGVLSSFLPKVLAISQREVNVQIAHLASEGLRLASVLAHHRLKISDKVLMCTKSVEYARHANNANTLVPALIELADAYEFDNQIDECLKTLQEALYYSPQASPLVQSRAYSNNAAILAQVGRSSEAKLYIQLAHEVFPDDPLLDRGYKLADASVFTLSYHTGLVRLNTGQITQAPAGFDFYKEHPSGKNVPQRLYLEIVNGRSRAAIQASNLEQYAHLFESALVGAVRLRSRKRFDEAIRIFQGLSQDWLTTKPIEDLIEKYHLKKSA